MKNSLLRRIMLVLSLNEKQKLSAVEQAAVIKAHVQDYAAQKFQVAMMRAKTPDEADRLEKLFKAIYQVAESSQDESILNTWIIYNNPSDLSAGTICARMHTINGPTDQMIEGNLESLRERFSSQGLINIGRNVNDDPVIVEVWL